MWASAYDRILTHRYRCCTAAQAPFHGMNSQRISFTSGQGVAAVGNRGLGNEGLYIEADKTCVKRDVYPLSHTRSHKPKRSIYALFLQLFAAKLVFV